MKYIYLLVIFILFSCSNTELDEKYKVINEQIEINNKILDDKILLYNNNLLHIEFFSDLITTYLKKIDIVNYRYSVFYNYLKFLKSNTKNIDINQIDTLKLLIDSINFQNSNYFKDYDSNSYIISYLKQNSFLSDSIINNQKWENYYFKNNSKIQNLTFLNKLGLDIKISHYVMISYFISDITFESGSFCDFKPFISYTSQIVPVDSYFEAEIYLSPFCETFEPKIYVNNNPLKVENGYALFTEKVTSKIGKVQNTGEIHVESPATGKIIKVPFLLEYEVIE
jgi:hypothetical protein